MEKEKDGVWRTIRGRRIFIGKGESLGEAMAKSGKFNRSDIRETKEGLSQADRFDDTNKKSLKDRQKAINKMRSKSVKYSNSVYTKDRKDEKNRINENAHIEGSGQTRVQRNWNKYSEEDRREHRHELIQKKLADYKAKKQSNNKIEKDYVKESKEFSKNNASKLTGDDYTKSLNKYMSEHGELGGVQGNLLVYNSDENEFYKAKLEHDKQYLENKQSNNKYEKQYDSVVDRYNKDEKFRDMLKNEHDKTIEATRKEIKSFLQGKKYFEKNGIENEDDLYNQINDNYYNVSREDFDKIYKEEYDKNAQEAYETRQREGLDKFIQKTDMYGGEREYSNEDLKRMEDAGVRPMAHSYTGGGWEGLKYDSKLTTKEIGKRVTDEMKKNYPDVKIARRGDNYSMGSSIDFNIMSSDKDLYVSDNDIDKMTDFGRLSVGYGFTNWAEKNVDGFKKYTHEQYTDNDVRKYAKEQLSNIRKNENQNVKGDEWYLSDYGKKVVSALNKEADSYTYNDSDGMVDYFDHGTYMHISIGKWNKPYQVNESKKIKDYVSKKKSNH